MNSESLLNFCEIWFSREGKTPTYVVKLNQWITFGFGKLKLLIQVYLIKLNWWTPFGLGIKVFPLSTAWRSIAHYKEVEPVDILMYVVEWL